jgi:hypothetical protein
MPATASTTKNSCAGCSGSGYVQDEKVADCRLCTGIGHFDGETCFICNGDGFEMKLVWDFCRACENSTDAAKLIVQDAS